MIGAASSISTSVDRRPQQKLRFLRSTSGRFAVLHIVFSLACTLPVLLFVFFQIDHIIIADFARPLEFRQSNLERQYAKGGIAGLTAAVANRAGRAHRDQTAILLVDGQGRSLAGNLSAWPQDLPAPHDWTPSRLLRNGGTEPEEFLVRTMRLPSGHRLLLGGLLDNRADVHRAILLALLGALVLALPIALLGSLAIVREMNRMVAAIAIVGQHVGDGDLSRRAALDGSGDPIVRLRGSLNTLLDRIEVLVA
jgi:methyl-accepting chemotaxis protein